MHLTVWEKAPIKAVLISQKSIIIFILCLYFLLKYINWQCIEAKYLSFTASGEVCAKLLDIFSCELLSVRNLTAISSGNHRQ